MIDKLWKLRLYSIKGKIISATSAYESNKDTNKSLIFNLNFKELINTSARIGHLDEGTMTKGSGSTEREHNIPAGEMFE